MDKNKIEEFIKKKQEEELLDYISWSDRFIFGYSKEYYKDNSFFEKNAETLRPMWKKHMLERYSVEQIRKYEKLYGEFQRKKELH